MTGEMDDKPIKVLLIEDNEGDARLIRETLAGATSAAFDLVWADRLSTGLAHLPKGGIDLVLLDLSLPDSQGLDTFVRVHAQAPEVPIIMMTGLDDEALVIKAAREGAQEYLVKGEVDGKTLSRVMRYAIERRRLMAELEQSTRKLQASEASYRKMNEELRKANEIKDDFVANVSHELRTPLATISNVLGNARAGVWGNPSPELKEGLLIGERNVKRLANLIGNLLDFSKIKAGKVFLERSLVDISQLIQGVTESLRPHAEEKGISLISSQDQELERVVCDSDRVVQILYNLVGNALKFTGSGGTVSVRVKNGQDHITASVSDTGIGIPEEKLSAVFERFQQVSRSDSAGEKGTGLGLPITKELVELHGGEIWAESKLGKGSTFTFTLPRYSVGQILRDYVHLVLMKNSIEVHLRGSSTSLSAADFERLKEKCGLDTSK